MPNPDHHAIALNNARVIEAFSASLEKMKKERAELVSWLKREEYYYSQDGDDMYNGMAAGYANTLKEMGEKVDE